MESAPARQRRTAEARGARRARILAAASRLFAARVYHRVRMEDVARASRVGKGTLYRYFPSKDELYLAIVDEALALLTERLEAEQAAPAPPPAILRRMIEALVETVARHLPFFRLVHRGEGRLLARKHQLFRDRRARIVRLLGEVLRRGSAAGTFHQVDPELTPSMLLGMVWGTTLNHAEDVPAPVLATRIAQVALHGLLARGDPGT